MSRRKADPPAEPAPRARKPRRETKTYPLFCEYQPCGNSFEARRPQTKYCSARCRNAAKRERDAERRDAAPPADEEGGEGLVLGELAETTASALLQVERLTTPVGLATMILARRLDASPERESATGLATLVREFRTSYAAAVADANRSEGDPVADAEREAAKRRSGFAVVG